MYIYTLWYLRYGGSSRNRNDSNVQWVKNACMYTLCMYVYVCMVTMPPTYLTASWAFKSIALEVGLTAELFPAAVSPWVRAWMNFWTYSCMYVCMYVSLRYSNILEK